MRLRSSLPALLAGAIGLALVALGIVYLIVACENLPGFLGPHAGDTSPRTGLGIITLVLGAGVFGAAFQLR
jgi:hypothetical protein